MRERPPVSAEDMDPGRSSGDANQPVVIGPIAGPPVIVIDDLPRTRPPDPVVTPWSAPTQPPRLRADLPDAESFIAPDVEGLYASFAADPPGELRSGLEPYVPYTSPETPADPELFNIAQIVVKFVEGSSVRLDGANLVLTREVKEPVNIDRLSRAGIELSTLRRQVTAFNRLVTARGVSVGSAAPQVDFETLAMLHRRAEDRSGAEMANPNLFYFVHSEHTDPKATADLLGELQLLEIVEAVYFQPIPFDAAVDIPPTTMIDVTSAQGYFRPSPTGIDVDMARRFAGGRGEGVRIVDIEAGWNTGHEDLPPMSFGYGINWGFVSGEHGTAVLGEIAAQENGFGANGIAPMSAVGWSSVTNIDPFRPWLTYFYSVGSALLSSLFFLRPGDIALIEQHYPNAFAGPCPNMCVCSQFGYVAVETTPWDHAAIRMATAAGVVVVEAAGNGQVMVTPASPFDSGAIVVGASNNDLTPACFTNFGLRVNVHAWGSMIGTLGTGEIPALRANGADPLQWYTRSFGGTSGASPIVVGAAALVQGTRAARGLDKLTSEQMRSLLVATGTPQAAATVGTNIGPLPNLAAAIATYIPEGALFVSQTSAPSAIGAGSIFSQSVTFRNSGGLPWVGATMAILPSDDGSFPWGTMSFILGSASAPVMPGDEVTGVFSVHAPANPGTYPLTYRLGSSTGAHLAFSPRQYIAVTNPAGTAFDNAILTILQAPGSVHVNESAIVVVSARNTGTTTWILPGYGLTLLRTGRIALPVNHAPLTVAVPPGQTGSFSFIIQGAATPGLGGFSAQMTSPSGSFGQSVGMNVVCQA